MYDFIHDQKDVFEALRHSFLIGKKRPMVYASVAWGKTVLSAHICNGALERGKRVIFAAPYITLINQTARSFEKQGLPKAGIIQANHPDFDLSNRLQIASIQTLARRGVPDCDLMIIDEAHIQYKSIMEWMDNSKTPVIGLSGSPFSKGLGKYYNNLIKAMPMLDLMKNGALCNYKAYSHSIPDLDDIPTVGEEFHETKLGERMSEPKIIGDLVETWLKFGQDLPTITFAVNVAHANHISAEFNKIGVLNVVITANTETEQRDVYFKSFNAGILKMLINVGTLVAGFDADARCMLDAAPVKSRIRHVQKAGRVFRTADGKDYAIILDNAGNLIRVGFPEFITIDQLCSGDKKEVQERKKKEKKELEDMGAKLCPCCNYLKKPDEFACTECGFIPKKVQGVEFEKGNLKIIKGDESIHSKEEMDDFWSGLLGYQKQQKDKGKKEVKHGYICHVFKEKFGVWPDKSNKKIIPPSNKVLDFLTYKRIKFAKSKANSKNRIKEIKESIK